MTAFKRHLASDAHADAKIELVLSLVALSLSLSRVALSLSLSLVRCLSHLE